jgi:hypothetical protein
MRSQVKALITVPGPTAHDHACQAGGYAPSPSEADQAEVLRLRERFRGHHIFYVVSADRGVRYMAHGAAAGARPHTIITGDLAELRHELEQAGAAHPGPGPEGQFGWRPVT